MTSPSTPLQEYKSLSSPLRQNFTDSPLLDPTSNLTVIHHPDASDSMAPKRVFAAVGHSDEWDDLDIKQGHESDSDFILNSVKHLASSGRDKIKEIWHKQNSRFANRFGSKKHKKKHHNDHPPSSFTNRVKGVISKQRSRLIKSMQTPEGISFRDRFSFVLGILLLVVSEYVILEQSQYMALLYTALLSFLIPLRWYLYSKQKFQNFLLDFCYFSQLFTLLALHFFPTNAKFNILVYSIANGPLLMAIPVWQNSLVFHSIDKLTSSFIHIFPALVMYVRRWYPSQFINLRHVLFDSQPTPQETTFSSICLSNDCQEISLYDTIWMPLVAYGVWQTSYYLYTEILRREKFRDDVNLVTSKRWLISHPSPVQAIAQWSGVHPRFYVFVFIGCQALFHFLSALPVAFMYKYQFVNKAVIAVIFFSLCWNGASYYFIVFTRKFRRVDSRSKK